MIKRKAPNQAVDRTAAPRVFDEGGSHVAAFGHWRRRHLHMKAPLLSFLLMAQLTLSGLGVGLPPWQLGMSKSQVAGFKEFGPYKEFSNGDLETNEGRFHGEKANVQFFFKADRLRSIGVYLFEGKDPKKGIPAWQRAYAAIQKEYGKIDMPDISVQGPKDERSLAIAAAANADIAGRTTMFPVKQPDGMIVSGQFWTADVQGAKWYFVAVFFDAPKPKQ